MNSVQGSVLPSNTWLQDSSEYLRRHSISDYLRELVTAMLLEKPSDPFQWMRDQLEGRLAKTRNMWGSSQ